MIIFPLKFTLQCSSADQDNQCQSTLLFCGWRMHCKIQINESCCLQSFLTNIFLQHSFSTLFHEAVKLLELLDTSEMVNKKLNKLQYYLKQTYSGFVAHHLLVFHHLVWILYLSLTGRFSHWSHFYAVQIIWIPSLLWLESIGTWSLP